MNDKMIANLETKGFKRWTKGNMDRLYINAEYLGYEPETASAAAKLNGEYISKSEARRITNAKTYIDLKDDTLHSDGYWNDDLKNAAQALIDEAAAEIETEEKAKAERVQAVEETEAEEAPEVTEEETMENKKWYAVMTDHDDNDWGTGSYDRDEAEQMVIMNIDIHPNGYIAVIEEGADPVCVDEIEVDDFDLRIRYWKTDVLAKWFCNADAYDDWMMPDVFEELQKRAGLEDMVSDEGWSAIGREIEKILGVNLGI